MSDHGNSSPVALAESPGNGEGKKRRLLDAIAREERKLHRRKSTTIVYWVIAVLLVVGTPFVSLLHLADEVEEAVLVVCAAAMVVFWVLAPISTVFWIVQGRAVSQQKILAALQEMNGKLSQLIEAQGKH